MKTCGCQFCLQLTDVDNAIMEAIRERWRYPLNHWLIHSDELDLSLMHMSHAMRRRWLKMNPLVNASGVRCGGSLRDLWCDYPHTNPMDPSYGRPS